MAHGQMCTVAIDTATRLVHHRENVLAIGTAFRVAPPAREIARECFDTRLAMVSSMHLRITCVVLSRPPDAFLDTSAGSAGMIQVTVR